MPTDEEKALQYLQDALQNDTEGSERILGSETCIYVLDCSGSMSDSINTAGPGPNQFTPKVRALKDAMLGMLEERLRHQKEVVSTDEIGIIVLPASSFGRSGEEGGKAAVAVPPSPVTEEHLDAVRRLYASGGTPLSDAMMKSIEVLDHGMSGLVRLVVVSDGVPDNREACLEVAHKLADEYGVVIDTVGVGSPDAGAWQYDEAFLIELARIGEGTFTRISDAEALKTKFLDAERERRALMGGGILLLGPGKPSASP